MNKELTEKQKTDIKEQTNNKYDANAQAISEFAFVGVPLIVVSFVYIFIGKTVREILASPEWSFAASVLMGQLVVKFAAGFIRVKSTSWRRLSAALAILIVLGLIPSILTLAMILILPKPPSSLIWIQISLFCLSTFLFVGFGSAIELSVLGEAVSDDS